MIGADEIDILEYAERYISTSCYKHLFCSPITNEEEMDLHIQAHMRNLKWISVEDLGCPVNFRVSEVPPLLVKAMKCTVYLLKFSKYL